MLACTPDGGIVFYLLIHICYRLEQYNDILLQENGLSLNVASPLFDITTLNAISEKEFNSQVVKVYFCVPHFLVVSSEFSSFLQSHLIYSVWASAQLFWS